MLLVLQTIHKVVDKMKAAGVPVELFMYPGSGHAFMNGLTEQGRAKIKGVVQKLSRRLPWNAV